MSESMDKYSPPLNETGATSCAATTAAAFYRRLLEQICKDPRRTRARKLAESGLLFWDLTQAEAAKTNGQLGIVAAVAKGEDGCEFIRRPRGMQD